MVIMMLLSESSFFFNQLFRFLSPCEIGLIRLSVFITGETPWRNIAAAREEILMANLVNFCCEIVLK